jgi:hypothetical protein
MSTIPRCAVCWRLAVLGAQSAEEEGLPRRQVFDRYLENLADVHPGEGPFVECTSAPLELAGFGSLL